MQWQYQGQYSMAILKMKKPFIICAPSAGPFKKKMRNNIRKKIFENVVLCQDLVQVKMRFSSS